jgi:hypothetical protein
VHQIEGMTLGRLSRALVGFAIIGLLVFFTIHDQKIRVVTLAILAMFGLRTWVHSRRALGSEKKAAEELRRE